MKRHCQTSERTKTPADHRPKSLDTAAIREPLWVAAPRRCYGSRAAGMGRLRRTWLKVNGNLVRTAAIPSIGMLRCP
jgi:hypothetical protein